MGTWEGDQKHVLLEPLWLHKKIHVAFYPAFVPHSPLQDATLNLNKLSQFNVDILYSSSVGTTECSIKRFNSPMINRLYSFKLCAVEDTEVLVSSKIQTIWLVMQENRKIFKMKIHCKWEASECLLVTCVDDLSREIAKSCEGGFY